MVYIYSLPSTFVDAFKFEMKVDTESIKSLELKILFNSLSYI